ncbi:putative Lactonase, 7-bladed beta-propeller-domain-containing protein [Seiridium unicorne]|uniref:Lactonase, 7-bladed beta-propeller-domain-containing protein n=1 Tax=Seiridium unicorne TaxID=138068 RepID=A0ABR2VAH2_9PEZI
MVRLLPSIFLLLPLGLAWAEPMLTSRQDSTCGPRNLVVGAPGQILSYTYDGKNFTKTANSSAAGTTASWMIFKQPNHLYAVDENSNSTRLFSFNPTNSSLSQEPVFVGNGSAGVVSLGFDKNKTHLIGASYGQGQFDVWEISPADGSLKLVKQVPLPGPTGPAAVQSVHRAHQAVLDPSGQFFAIPDLGGDAIHFVDASTWEINNSIQVEPAGAGPRHGAFLGGNLTTLPQHYAVVCELKNLIILYEIEKTQDGKVNLTNPQTLSTFGAAFPPANATSAAAGELIAAHNGRDIYVSNRVTANETDSISHFLLQDGKLAFTDQISSGGLNPRQLSFSMDESYVFGVNQAGENGLVVFQRNCEDGILTPAGTLPNAEISTEAGFGPQFILETPM